MSQKQDIAAVETVLVGMRDRLAADLVESETFQPNAIKVGGGITRQCAIEWLEENPAAAEADLLFADPPFNIGHEYQGYDDAVAEEVHAAFWRLTIKGMATAARKKKRTTSPLIAVHVCHEMLHMTLDFARDAGLVPFNQIVRVYNFGQHQTSNWKRAHEFLLLFTVDYRKPVWQPRRVLEESARRKMGDRTFEELRESMLERLVDLQNQHSACDHSMATSDTITWIKRMTNRTPDRRLKGTKWKGWVPPKTVWHFARPQGNNGERWETEHAKHPNQLPLAYMARLALAHVRPGRTVAEACTGSGSLALVSHELGLDYHGCDICLDTCASAKQRVKDEEQRKLARAAIEEVSAPKRLTLPAGRDWSKVKTKGEEGC